MLTIRLARAAAVALGSTVMGAQPRDMACEVIARRITTGEWPGGGQLDEQRLAADLGVDRGTVREALACLVRDGLAQDDGDGFVVAPLDEAWLREAYPIALLLEGLAVRSAAPFDAETIARLRTINAELRELGPRDARLAAERDFDFHDVLVGHSDNERLLTTVRPMKRMLVRYERAAMEGEGVPAASAAMHDEIIRLLENGDQEGAARAVEENYRRALPNILARVAEPARG
jgi:DNA-binding GntR family transcriptional regulator